MSRQWSDIDMRRMDFGMPCLQDGKQNADALKLGLPAYCLATETILCICARLLHHHLRSVDYIYQQTPHMCSMSQVAGPASYPLGCTSPDPSSLMQGAIRDRMPLQAMLCHTPCPVGQIGRSPATLLQGRGLSPPLPGFCNSANTSSGRCVAVILWWVGLE